MEKITEKHLKGSSRVSGEVKRELLDAARRLLSNVGREGATMRAICSEAKVGPPTLYYYYGDLNGLHRAAIDETYQEVAEAYQIGTEKRGALQGVREGWETFMLFAKREPNMCRVVMRQIIDGEPPTLVASTLEKVANDLSQLDDRGFMNLSATDTAQLLWMSALGSICFALGNADSERTAFLQRSMMDMTIDALIDHQDIGI